MKKIPSARQRYQRATVSLAFGKHAGVSAEVKITSQGLLAVATLVSAILLSTAILVNVAATDRARVADR